MMIKKDNKYDTKIIASTCLLLSIATSDEKLDNCELSIIQDIIVDFFSLDKRNMNNIIDISLLALKESTDLYEFSTKLNESFCYQDKVDFICCAFEVAFSDGELHYLEEFFIKKIANILNVQHDDLIKSKQEIKSYLK